MSYDLISMADAAKSANERRAILAHV